jgi:hypothetical protein
MPEQFKYLKWAAGGSAQFFLFEKKNCKLVLTFFLENKLTYAGTIQMFKGGGRRLCPILFLKKLVKF